MVNPESRNSITIGGSVHQDDLLSVQHDDREGETSRHKGGQQEDLDLANDRA